MTTPRITVAQLAAIQQVLDDLWMNRVTPDTFADWRTAHLDPILNGLVAAELALRDAAPVEVV